MKFQKQFSEELLKYTTLEKLMVVADFLLAIAIILFSQKLIRTTFGKASASFGLVMLGMVAILRVVKKWGPKE